jgi:hypothetical protein
MFGRSKALNRIATSITAEDICNPFILELDAAFNPQEAEQRWDERCMEDNSDPFDHLALVTKNGTAVGWSSYASLAPAQGGVEDTMDPLTVANLISANTPLLEIARLYTEQSPWIFVALKCNKPIGWISYYNLLGPPFRACLFGLLLGIEQAMADLLKTDAKFAVSKLPAKRLESATRVFGLRGYAKRRRQEPTPSELIDCTTFIDKVTAIEACPATLNALPSFNRSSLVKTEALRNALAHPTSDSELISLLPKNDLQGLIQWLTTFEADLAPRLQSGAALS